MYKYNNVQDKGQSRMQRWDPKEEYYRSSMLLPFLDLANSVVWKTVISVRSYIKHPFIKHL